MGKFSKVQFVGMSICTTPAMLTSIEQTSDDGYYAGYENDVDDLKARIEIIKDFIKTTVLANEIDNNDSTLKVFVIPEFFMRGVLGAYYNTWVYPMEALLVKEFETVIKDLVSEKIKINDSYLFVLGTILSTKSPVEIDKEPTKSLYYSGDNLLDIYYRLHPKDSTSNFSKSSVNKLSDILQELDGKKSMKKANDSITSVSNEDNSFVDILVKTLNYCDTQAKIEVGNRCLVISGIKAIHGQTADLLSGVFIIQKQFKSKEDFILNSKNSDQVSKLPKYLQTITKYPDIDNKESDRKKYAQDGLAIFEYEGVKIGVDICLDHSRQRLVKHLLKNPNDNVDIQIVTSCGMSVRTNAVIARKGGYVFNCDGEYELSSINEGNNGKCSHTTLQKVSKSIVVNNKEVVEEAQLDVALSLLGDKAVTIPQQKALFRFNNYNIHIYPSVNLK